MNQNSCCFDDLLGCIFDGLTDLGFDCYYDYTEKPIDELGIKTAFVGLDSMKLIDSFENSFGTEKSCKILSSFNARLFTDKSGVQNSGARELVSSANRLFASLLENECVPSGLEASRLETDSLTGRLYINLKIEFETFLSAEKEVEET